MDRLVAMKRVLAPHVEAQRSFLRIVRSVRRAIDRATDERSLQRIPAVRRYPY